MALDTRNKRSSAIQPMMPWRGQYPAPDGTIAQADRQHSSWLYAGILADAPVVNVFVNAGITIYAIALKRTIEPVTVKRTIYSPFLKRTIYSDEPNRSV